MRIGLDLRMAGTDYGIGRYSFELAQRIVNLDQVNHYVLFVRDLAKFKDAGFDRKKNVTLVSADFRHYSFDEQWKFKKVLDREQLDLVHFMSFNVPLLYRGPFIATIHDMVHHRLPGNKKRRILHRLAYRMVMRHAVLHSEAVITVSNFSKKEILAFYDVSPLKIKVIYEAATPVPVTDSDVNSAKQRHGINKPYVIFVGVLERKKNVAALARAFDVLKEKYLLNIQLVLAGKEDPYYPEVAQEVRGIKYRNDLVITGVIDEKDKYALYKGAEAFVSASLLEGFGLPGVEAMSLGVPLIVANTDVFNEVYDNGAIYFDPLDPEDIAHTIHLLLTDEKYKQLIANNAYLRSQFFSWEQAAKETIRVYNSVLK
jgi:glycosyltransferase involved in cell wall biosynthesis